MTQDSPIYNSRIIKIYLEYLKKIYPDIDIDELLSHAMMTRYEVEDPAHWFSQVQADRFYEILVLRSGNPNIAKDAGRFTASAEGLGPAKQYAMGFLSLASVYLLMRKIYPLMSRGATIQAKKLGSNKVAIVSTPNRGVDEKPYQCENRLGIFESLPKMFIEQFARIEHPECFHKGDDACRYIISWEKSPFFIWKQLRNYAFLLNIAGPLVLFFFLPIISCLLFSFGFLFLTLIVSFYSHFLEKKYLRKTIHAQGDGAKRYLDEMNIRYNNALLVQEIGQAAVSILNVKKLIITIVGAMEKHLDFDRGMIMLPNKNKSRLVYAAGYGYSEEKEKLLKKTEFHLDKQNSGGFLTLAFHRQKPVFINNIAEVEEQISERSRRLAKQMGVHSLICVPIVYEKESLGILAVDNVESKRPLTKSDENLLMGIVSQTAVSITNAISFQKIQKSEERYRTILQSMEEGYYELDISGRLTFFNDSLCRILGYSCDELIGMSNQKYTDKENAKIQYQAFNRVYTTGLPSKRVNWVIIRKDGVKRDVESSISLIKDSKDRKIGFRGIIRDITDRRREEKEKEMLLTRLQQAKKMEAIGTLAGGVAHDLNNILAGLVSYPDLLLMDLSKDSPLTKPILTMQQSGKKAAAIVQDLLTLARRGVTVTKVVSLNQIVTEYLRSPEYLKLKSFHPDIEVKFDSASDLFNTLGSPVHLSKTVMNLVSNAAEAMPLGGKISISTENRFVEQPIIGYDRIEKGEYIVLEISDTGIGISPDDLEKIFEPFYTRKTMGRSGTGLGMAVVWGTVKDLNGYIDVKSTVGEGSTFTLYFPVTKEEAAGDKSISSLQDYMGKGESILVIDDVEEQREIASGMLKKLGYSVSLAASGEEAVEFMKNNSADLLVLDMIMAPGIDGLETYKRIHKMHPGQKAIVASGFSETDRVRATQSLGAGPYLKKPYTLDKIGLVVKAELRK